MKKIICLIISAVLLLSTPATVMAADAGMLENFNTVYNPFTDVARPNYAFGVLPTPGYEGILYAYYSGAMLPVAPNVFGVGSSITLGEGMEALIRAYGPIDFSQTIWANGYDSSALLTYADISYYMWIASGQPKANRYGTNNYYFEKAFKNSSEWYVSAVMWAGSKCIISGLLPSGKFNTKQLASFVVSACPREDFANMFYLHKDPGQLPISCSITTPVAEVPYFSEMGKNSGKQYYISLDSAGTVLLTASRSMNIFEVGAAVPFLVCHIGDRDEVADPNDSIFNITGNNIPASTRCNYYTIQFATESEMGLNTYDPISAIEITNGNDLAGNSVKASILCGTNGQHFTFEPVGNGGTYVKTMNNNYLQYTGNDFILTADKASATPLFFLPITQYGN